MVMKRFVRLLSVVCVLAMLGTTLAVLVSAEGYQYETPVEPSNWEENDFDITVTGDDATCTIGEGLGWIRNSKYSGKVFACKEEKRKSEN